MKHEKISMILDVLCNFCKGTCDIILMMCSKNYIALAFRTIADWRNDILAITKRRNRRFACGAERLNIAVPVDAKYGKKTVFFFFFQPAMFCLIFLTCFAFPFDVPAQTGKGVFTEYKSDGSTGYKAGNDNASKISVGKPVGNRHGRVKRIHFFPPLWLVLAGSLMIGVFIGTTAGLVVNVMVNPVKFKE